MKFGPVNLWTLPPAWWFYMPEDEKTKLALKTYWLYHENDFELCEKMQVNYGRREIPAAARSG
jgi:hypothetical protein